MKRLNKRNKIFKIDEGELKPMVLIYIVTKHLIKELQETIMGGHIRKIYQPETMKSA